MDGHGGNTQQSLRLNFSEINISLYATKSWNEFQYDCVVVVQSDPNNDPNKIGTFIEQNYGNTLTITMIIPGPNYNKFKSSLSSCFRTCYLIALNRSRRSIAFCPIDLPPYNDNDQVPKLQHLTRIAFKTSIDYILRYGQTNLQSIIYVCNDDLFKYYGILFPHYKNSKTFQLIGIMPKYLIFSDCDERHSILDQPEITSYESPFPKPQPPPQAPIKNLESKKSIAERQRIEREDQERLYIRPQETKFRRK